MAKPRAQPSKPATVTAARLRAHAVTRSLFDAPDIVTAVGRLGFVQADPIRAPARAQDLILHQRVAGYRAGDLEAQFPSLPLAEEYVHLYGFVALETRALLYPRTGSRTFAVEREQPQLRRAILAHVRRHGVAHPRDVAAAIGGPSVTNAWGGQSAATTRMLEALSYEGRLTVRHRQGGVKVYAPAPARARALSTVARARELIALLVRLYAPLPLPSLNRFLWQLGDRAPDLVLLRAQVPALIADGTFSSGALDGVTYVWPADDGVSLPHAEAPERVRFLAPFDPVVWDRARFAQLWGWDYRFEAYTPIKKRLRGYYALPLLWRDQVIGWANATYDAALALELGFIGRRPRDAAFVRALDEAEARLDAFLQPREE